LATNLPTVKLAIGGLSGYSWLNNSHVSSCVLSLSYQLSPYPTIVKISILSRSVKRAIFCYRQRELAFKKLAKASFTLSLKYSSAVFKNSNLQVIVFVSSVKSDPDVIMKICKYIVV
jgi:hypothetical protein